MIALRFGSWSDDGQEAAVSSDDRVERIQRNLEQVLRFITEEGGAGGMVGPEGFVVGIPNRGGHS